MEKNVQKKTTFLNIKSYLFWEIKMFHVWKKFFIIW